MFELTRQGAVDVIRGEGPLHGEVVDDLAAIFSQCLRGGQPLVVLNMHRIQLLDSRGLTLLLDTQDDFSRRGGALKLASPTTLCRDILLVTGVAAHFEVYADAKSAVGSFVR